MDIETKVVVLKRIIANLTGVEKNCITIHAFEEAKEGITVNYACTGTERPCRVLITWWAIMFS